MGGMRFRSLAGLVLDSASRVDQSAFRRKRPFWLAIGGALVIFPLLPVTGPDAKLSIGADKRAEVRPGDFWLGSFRPIAFQQTILQRAIQNRRTGEKLEFEGRLKEALAEYESAVDLSEKVPPDPQNRELARLLKLTTRIKIARLQRRLGSFTEAEATYKSLIPEAQQVVERFRRRIPFQLTSMERDLTRTYCDALVDATEFYRELNQPGRARTYWGLLDAITAETSPATAWEQVTPLFWAPRIAALYLDGELSRIEADLDRALKACQEAKALVKKSISLLRKTTGNEGLIAELQAIESTVTVGLALCHYDLAQVNPQTAKEDYARAKSYYEEALASFGTNKSQLSMALQASCRRNLGICYHEWAKLSAPPDRESLAKAESELRQAEKICLQMTAPAPQDLAHTYNSLGLLFLETGRPEEADRMASMALEQLRSLAEISANYELRRNALLLRARATWELAGGDPMRRKEAITFATQALECVRQQLRQVIGDPFRRGRARQTLWGRIEGTLVSWYEALLASGEEVQLADVLSVFELSRAQSLLEEMAMVRATREGSNRAGALAGLLEELQNAQPKLAEVSFKLRSVQGKNAEALAQELRAWEARYQDLLRRMWTETGGPRFAGELLEEMNSQRVDDILRWIEDRKLLVLYYLVDRDRSFLLIIPPHEARTNWKLLELQMTQDHADILNAALTAWAAQTKPNQPAISVAFTKLSAGALPRHVFQILLNPLSGLLAVLSDAQATVPQRVLQSLGEILIPSPAQERLLDTRAYETLLVIADGPLARFPFQALIIPYGVEDKFVVEVANPIVYAPSLTVGYRLDTSTRPEVRAALCLGKAAFTEYQPIFGNRLPPLPDAVYECAWVSRALEEKGLKVIRVVDESREQRQVTKAALQQLVAGAQLVHLVTHGLGGEEHGEWGGCLLFSASEGDDPYTGILTLPEIYRLPLESTELVLLSACLTYSGVELEGEGIWAVARGFLAAGARQTVATLWSVESQATRELMGHLASELNLPGQTGNSTHSPTGSSLGAHVALRKAQLHLMKRSEWQRPYFWAPFVLVGAPR
ncbi:MAG: CHAT domain-containing protein [Thermoguttaceae bacterium]|nr:CHAT domain-containing protein [Thermoguttaceae bacterium]MDW8078860.1 CHAT domain-containing protein [Thermoguttaceae bacterium]